MDEKDNSRSSLQTAADLGRAAKAVYRIAQAAAVSGVHGAAAAAVKETVPALVKFLLAVLLIISVGTKNRSACEEKAGGTLFGRRWYFMITEEMLCAAAARSCEIYVSYLERGYNPENQHEFSLQFKKKIKKLKRKADHPVFYHAARRIASIVLAILIAGGVWITVDAEARAAFVGWVKEIYGTYFVYHFEGSSDVNKELVDYRPTLIPNGYTEFYSDTTEDTIIVVYANEEGEMLKFSYSHNPDNTTWFVGADSLTVQPITINGISGEAITSTEQGAATAIMWITTENTAFNISGFLSVEDLIAMAESLYEK